MNEEFEKRCERTMEFLLSQQAKHDAAFQRLEEAQVRTEESANRAHESIMRLAGFMQEGFGLTISLFKQTDTQIRELKDSQKLTDEKLRNLADLINRIRERGKGENGTQN